MKKAVIFDLDGVICSTDKYHYQAWKFLADMLGIPFDETVNNLLRGVSRRASLEIILAKDPSRTEYTEDEKHLFEEQKNMTYRILLRSLTPDDILPGVKEVLNRLRKDGVKLGIGSSSRNTPVILKQLGLEHFFDEMADGSMITHSKPDPEVFLKAADLLGVSPEEALVVEDAVSGAEAAHRGGFIAVCVGDASAQDAGDWNLTDIEDLIQIVREN